MTINVIDRDSQQPVCLGSTVKGIYGEPWIFLAMSDPFTVWLRDPITLQVVDLDPMVLAIDVNITG